MTEAIKYSDGIQMIVDEHVPLRKQMGEIEAIIQNLEVSGNVENLHTIVSNFVQQIKVHSDSEDKALSPLLGKHLGMDARPVVGNEEQHIEAMRLLGQYQEQYESFRGGEKSRLADIAESLSSVVKHLTDHFDFEEEKLFPLAERTLSDEDKAELVAKLQARK